jgi:hypothetical protein
LNFIASFLAKESRMLCSAICSSMILVGASSSESSEYEDESDMVLAEQKDERAGRVF